MSIVSYKRIPSDSSINILSEKDSFILRCHYCFSIPIIYIDLTNEIPLINSYCRCKNKKVYPIKEFLEKFNEILLSTFICIECHSENKNNNENKDDLDLIQSSSFKICLDCNKFYCEKCSEKHQKNNKGHKLVYLKNFDYICINDLLYADAYCKDCNINICKNCIFNKHFEHHIINYSDLIISEKLEENIKKIQRKLDLKTKRYYEFMDKYGNTNENNINSNDINQFTDIFFENLEINSQLNLLLYCNYKLYSYQKEKKRFNYAGLNNIIQTSNFNFPIMKNDFGPNENDQEKFNIISNFFKYDLIINSPIELIDIQKKYILKKTIYSKPLNDNDIEIPKQTPVNCLLILKNIWLLSGRDDGQICIYDLFELNLLKDHQCHNNKIDYLIELKNEENEIIKICSCSEDKSIKFWKISFNKDNSFDDFKIQDISFNFLHEISNAHKERINKIIEIDNNSIASCSFDKKIYFWDKNNYKNINEISTNNEITNICKCAKTLIIGNKKDLNFYDLDIKDFIGKMNDFPCLNNNCLINIDNKKFIYGRNDGKIFLIQIGTLKIIKIFEVDSKIQTINLLNNGLIILIGEDQLIKRINIYDGNKINSGKTNAFGLFTTVVQLGEQNCIAASNKLGLIEIFNLE